MVPQNMLLICVLALEENVLVLERINFLFNVMIYIWCSMWQTWIAILIIVKNERNHSKLFILFIECKILGFFFWSETSWEVCFYIFLLDMCMYIDHTKVSFFAALWIYIIIKIFIFIKTINIWKPFWYF